MKHRATIDLEFTNGDLFEQEVIKAMRAYAKTIAREAFQTEVEKYLKGAVVMNAIHEEIKRVVPQAVLDALRGV